jgi:uncharacterized membrane protein
VTRQAVLRWAIWAILALAVLTLWWSGRAVTLLAGLPALGYVAVMLTFARTLRRGHEPLITRFCRFHYNGRVPDECLGYTRRWTVAWAILTGLFGLEVVALALLGHADWTGPANLINIALMVALFLGEHVLRAWTFPHLPTGTPLETGRVVLQAMRGR